MAVSFLNHNTNNQFRNLNDGLQPWFSDRQRFGLRALKSQALLETEEGLAAVNTLLQANHKLLFFPALTYCKYFCIHILNSYTTKTCACAQNAHPIFL